MPHAGQLEHEAGSQDHTGQASQRWDVQAWLAWTSECAASSWGCRRRVRPAKDLARAEQLSSAAPEMAQASRACCTPSLPHLQEWRLSWSCGGADHPICTPVGGHEKLEQARVHTAGACKQPVCSSAAQGNAA